MRRFINVEVIGGMANFMAVKSVDSASSASDSIKRVG